MTSTERSASTGPLGLETATSAWRAPGPAPADPPDRTVHASSYEKVRAFRDAYLEPSAKSVLSVTRRGAMAHEEQDSLPALFAGSRYSFTGLDIAEGRQRGPRARGRLPLEGDPTGASTW